VLNLEQRTWELRGADYDRVHGKVTVDVITRHGIIEVNRAGAAKGWPRLAPGCPWIHCYLRGGPLDGLHEYLDPADWDDPPDRLVLSVDRRIEVPAIDAEQPEMIDVVPPAIYRRQIQGCGHGRACAYPYSHDEGRW
jgi:hypothetical protein